MGVQSEWTLSLYLSVRQKLGSILFLLVRIIDCIKPSYLDLIEISGLTKNSFI